jgi:hypothetical protein
MIGELGILNVGTGDTKLSFDPNNPQDCIRAARIVKDMLRRGFALLVKVRDNEDGTPIYQRALDFDDTKYEYIIADFDPLEAAKVDQEEESRVEGAAVGTDQAQTPQGEVVTGASAPVSTTGKRSATKRIPAAKTSGVAVARSAGG